MNSLLAESDIRGHRIVHVWQTIELNPGAMDFADHVFELNTGVRFRLPFDRDEPLSIVDIPPSAKLLELPIVARLRESAIEDICCPKEDEWVNCEAMYVLLDSGLWISQIVGAPHGISGIGIFAGPHCPWAWREECGIASYFRR